MRGKKIPKFDIIGLFGFFFKIPNPHLVDEVKGMDIVNFAAVKEFDDLGQYLDEKILEKPFYHV